LEKSLSLVAYYRVSTERQGQSALGLDAQKAAVAAFMRGKGELEGEFVEIESGRKDDQPSSPPPSPCVGASSAGCW
jgi:DNA invertase Pin-like site-specific DNA recombinase